MRWLRQSTSVDLPIGPFLDATDGTTAETALTLTQPDIRLKKGAGAWAQKAAAQTLTHEENGYYEVTLDATDTNTLGLLRLAVAEAGALPVWEDFIVLPANVYDSLVPGTDKLQVDTQEWVGAAPNALTAGRVDAIVGDYAAGQDPLQPTVAGRTLDVSATGEAGIDWANVGSPGTAITFTGTTINMVGSVTGSVGSVTGNVGGNVTGSVGSVSAGGITAASLAAGAITAAKIADGAIDAATFAAGAIDAAAIATGAIDADAIAADAVAEIQSGLATAAALDAVDNFVDTEVAAIKAVTDKLDTAVELDGAVYRFTVNALEQAPAGGGGVADWNADERTAIRTILGIPAAGTTPEAPAAGALKVIDDLIDTEIGAITTHLTDIKGATFSGATDSLEAIRDRGDAAWVTATGFSTLDAAGVRTAVGLAAANLDAQLAAIDDAIDTEVGAIKAKTDLITGATLVAGDLSGLATAAAVAGVLTEVQKVPRSGQTYRHTNQDTAEVADVTIGPAA